jgi:hypothetical protein
MSEIKDKSFRMRVDDDFFDALDRLRRRESDIPTRADMIRRLIERELASPVKKRESGRL